MSQENERRASGFRKLALGGVLLAVGLFAVYFENQKTQSAEPLDAIPDGAFLVATADLDRLRRSPIYDATFGGDSGRSLGLTAVEMACGFDPVKRVSKIALVVPEDGEKGEFGIAAKVNVTPDEIRACAAKMASSDRSDRSDGTAENHGDPKKQGDFYIIEGRGASLPRLAYRADNDAHGLLLVGKGTIVDAMMAAYEGRRPRIAASKAHSSLRALLAHEPAPALIVTSLLPESTRARIRGEMDADLSHGATQDSLEMMAGVLSVDSAGAAIVAGETDGVAEVRIELTCERPEACASVKQLIERKKAEFQRNLGIRLVAGALLDSFKVDDWGSRLSVHASARSGELAKMIERGLAWRKHSRDDTTTPALPNTDTTARPRDRAPDEVVNTRDAGAAHSVAKNPADASGHTVPLDAGARH